MTRFYLFPARLAYEFSQLGIILYERDFRLQRQTLAYSVKIVDGKGNVGTRVCQMVGVGIGRLSKKILNIYLVYEYFEQNIFHFSYFCVICRTVKILFETLCYYRFIIITNLVLFSIVSLEIRPGKLKKDF